MFSLVISNDDASHCIYQLEGFRMMVTEWCYQYEDGTTEEEDGSVSSSWREFSWCGKSSGKAIDIRLLIENVSTIATLR